MWNSKILEANKWKYSELQTNRVLAEQFTNDWSQPNTTLWPHPGNNQWGNKTSKHKYATCALRGKTRTSMSQLVSVQFVNGWKKNNCSKKPFPSSLEPLFQSESKCEVFEMKMSFSLMWKAELITITKLSHLDSLWNWGSSELGNGLLLWVPLEHTRSFKTPSHTILRNYWPSNESIWLIDFIYLLTLQPRLVV